MDNEELNIEELTLVVKLLEKSTTKEVVQDFLKSRNVSHSGTWSDLLDKRIIPAAKEGNFDVSELYGLLAAAEECGRQHVFLYKLPKKIISKFSREDLEPIVKKSDFSSLLDKPIVVDTPSELTICDIRWDGTTFVIKGIDQRVSYRSLGNTVTDAKLIKEYSIERSRAVYVLKVHQDGLCEVRVSSNSNSSDYEDEIRKFLRETRSLFAESNILNYPLNLQGAKSRMWERRLSLIDSIRFSDATLRNGQSTLRAASGSRDADLLTDAKVVKSVEEFSGDDVYCDSNNVFFKPLKDKEIPSKEIHVYMTGEFNEFVISAACNHNDYLYVLNRMLEFNNE